MTAKISTAMSNFRRVLGGVPQGSLVEVLLFNITIDCNESYLADVAGYSPPGETGLPPPSP